MSNKCGQATMPVLDETLDKCTTFNYSSCIQVSQICRKLGSIENESLDTFLEKLCNKLSKIDNEIYKLSNENRILRGRVDTLETTLANLNQ